MSRPEGENDRRADPDAAAAVTPPPPSPPASLPGGGDGDDDEATLIAAAPALPPADVDLPLAGPPIDTLPGVDQPGAAPKRLVGRYQIGERLGRGGMATVFKAYDPGIGRHVAIKFLHAALCEDEECRVRFLREARAAGGLSHPNIVTVHDVGEIEGRPYMAMELLDGATLAELMADGKPLPVRDVLVMAIQLARALNYAHARGIVHRDIKPGNIMRIEATRTIKVTDFGIAHMDSGSSTEQRTRVGDILGTPQYMSPEQAQGQRLDGRSDLFSTGILLYQMLTGQRPFAGDSLVSLALKITTEEPVPIQRLRPDLPPALRRIVERCLAKGPEQRFQTGKELSEALSRVLAEIDEAARERERPRILPLRVKWAAMMAMIVAGVMGLTGALITQRQQAAILEQVTDYGAALVRFLAAQNAVAALDEDWVSVDVAVQAAMKTGDFEGVTVVDRNGTVRAASVEAAVGKPYQAPRAEALGARDGGVVVSRYAMRGRTVLGFAAPITFQGKQLGRVALGLPEQRLVSLTRQSIVLMVVLAVVTVLAVAVAMYFVANWFARPIKLLGEGLAEIAAGRYGHRILETRKDEYGLLFNQFDRMAQALQERQALLGASTLASRSDTPAPDGAVPPEPGVAGSAGPSSDPAA